MKKEGQGQCWVRQIKFLRKFQTLDLPEMQPAPAFNPLRPKWFGLCVFAVVAQRTSPEKEPSSALTINWLRVFTTSSGSLNLGEGGLELKSHFCHPLAGYPKHGILGMGVGAPASVQD